MNVGSFRTDNFGDMLGTSTELKDYLGSGYYRDNTLDAYNVFNARLSYKFEGALSLQWLTVRATINNIFNRLYNAGGEGKHFFPAAERNFWLAVELGI
jgi:outer membrane receptor protein involved in Fe transport